MLVTITVTGVGQNLSPQWLLFGCLLADPYGQSTNLELSQHARAALQTDTCEYVTESFSEVLGFQFVLGKMGFRVCYCHRHLTLKGTLKFDSHASSQRGLGC